MLRINLLPQKKSRKADPGQQVVLLGLMAIIGAALLVWLFVHKPLEDDIAVQEAVNGKMRKTIKDLKESTKDFEKLESAFKAAEEQQAAIERLRQARAVPAWMLRELSLIMTKDSQPTMTPAMAKKVMDDPNRSWVQGWDPKHIWITGFEETRGRFKLTGGAQSDSDMTQLALRMQASMYFDEVLPNAGKEKYEKSSGVSYYDFTITGKVVY
jgi:Tfp pilus assembly protein PilN